MKGFESRELAMKSHQVRRERLNARFLNRKKKLNERRLVREHEVSNSKLLEADLELDELNTHLSKAWLRHNECQRDLRNLRSELERANDTLPLRVAINRMEGGFNPRDRYQVAVEFCLESHAMASMQVSGSAESNLFYLCRTYAEKLTRFMFDAIVKKRGESFCDFRNGTRGF